MQLNVQTDRPYTADSRFQRSLISEGVTYISLPKTREGRGSLHNTNLEERPERRTGRVTQNSHVACTTNSRSTAMTCKTRINNDRQERETGKKLGQNYDFYLQMNRPS